MKNSLTKEFLEKHLELWKTKVSKRKKWHELVLSYKEQHLRLTERLDAILKIFNIEEIDLLRDTFQEYEKKSKNKDNTFFEVFNNEKHIKKVFEIEYFQKNVEQYKETYFYEKIKDGHDAYLQNLKNFNDDVKKSFDKVGNWKKEEDSKLKYNSGKSKGCMLQYLIIEYLSENLGINFDKSKIIKFYDLSIKILWTPHSIKNAIGLHYNVNNNNFILQLLEFYKKINNINTSEWKEALNGAWKKEGNSFHVFNGNSLLELYSWINLGTEDEKKFISIYNDKTVSTLQILMGNLDDKLKDDNFYEMYKKYVNIYKPYPGNIEDNILKAIYADQFFQYIHELEIEEMNKNMIFYGAPGTGKTYHVTKQLIDFYNVKESNFKIVQFHPSYGYEDFIEGIKPKGLTKDGNIKFELVNGEFKQFCINASKKPNEDFYFIVDEINRAELSRTFGELLYCFEYRVKFEDDGSINYNKNKTNLIRTQYSNLIDNLENKDELSLYIYEDKSYFGIPENVYFIGTMNDIDRSIDCFDMALRRRFVWIRKDCDLEIVEEWLYEKKISDEISLRYIEACEALNKFIEGLNLGKSYQIGHAYFMKLKLENNSDNLKEDMLNELWEKNIKPLLTEYLKVDYNEHEIKDKLVIAKSKFCLKDSN
ncbi:McrB family protein [Aliarcobacter cryaerophilus]|uniref:McrB family protein n=1 Tax=Aliarcobacter cryaerophilus TaxID=28198 RepID=UPI003DA42F58